MDTDKFSLFFLCVVVVVVGDVGVSVGVLAGSRLDVPVVVILIFLYTFFLVFLTFSCAAFVIVAVELQQLPLWGAS